MNCKRLMQRKQGTYDLVFKSCVVCVKGGAFEHMDDLRCTVLLILIDELSRLLLKILVNFLIEINRLLLSKTCWKCRPYFLNQSKSKIVVFLLI
jgi:hypothetical protein